MSDIEERLRAIERRIAALESAIAQQEKINVGRMVYGPLVMQSHSGDEDNPKPHWPPKSTAG